MLLELTKPVTVTAENAASLIGQTIQSSGIQARVDAVSVSVDAITFVEIREKSGRRKLLNVLPGTRVAIVDEGGADGAMYALGEELATLAHDQGFVLRAI